MRWPTPMAMATPTAPTFWCGSETLVQGNQTPSRPFPNQPHRLFVGWPVSFSNFAQESETESISIRSDAQQFLLSLSRPFAAVELGSDSGIVLAQLRKRNQTHVMQHRIDDNLAGQRAILN